MCGNSRVAALDLSHARRAWIQHEEAMSRDSGERVFRRSAAIFQIKQKNTLTVGNIVP